MGIHGVSMEKQPSDKQSLRSGAVIKVIESLIVGQPLVRTLVTRGSLYSQKRDESNGTYFVSV